MVKKMNELRCIDKKGNVLPGMCNRAFVSVDLDAVMANIQLMKSDVSENTKLIAVIKTNAYGHGCVPIASELEAVDYIWGYAVATAEEAFYLRKNSIKKPILILGYTFPYSYEQFLQYDIRPAVFREDTLQDLQETAERYHKKFKIHIKVDTGMRRIGIQPDESGLQFIEKLKNYPMLEIEGIFTHFAKADEIDKNHALNQVKTFSDFLEKAEEILGYRIPIHHCSNSAGIMELPEANMDVARVGISMYGLYPSDEMDSERNKLIPALQLLSKIVYVKEIKKGMTVSYGGTYCAEQDRKIATIPIGYGDGYPRSLSNKGYVLIRGEKAPIVGRVCMDQFMVDVTDIQDVCEGDIVTLIGDDGEHTITAELLGDMSGRFNYELVCDLNKRLPRVYYKNNQVVEVNEYN